MFLFQLGDDISKFVKVTRTRMQCFYFNYVQRRRRRDVDDVVVQFGSGRLEDAMLLFLNISEIWTILSIRREVGRRERGKEEGM